MYGQLEDMAKASLRHVDDLLADVNLPSERYQQDFDLMAVSLQRFLELLSTLPDARIFPVWMRSHDLRTPLTSVVSFSQMIVSHPQFYDNLALNAEQAEHVRAVGRLSNRLMNALNEIFDFNRIQIGELHLSLTLYDLSSALERAVAAFRRLQGELAIRIASRSVSVVCYGDELMTSRLLATLCSALHQRNHSTVIELAAAPSVQKPNACEIEVSADGDPLCMDGLFEAENAFDQCILGFYIAKSIAAAQGGSLALDNGQSPSRYIISLPTQAAQSISEAS